MFSVCTALELGKILVKEKSFHYSSARLRRSATIGWPWSTHESLVFLSSSVSFSRDFYMYRWPLMFQARRKKRTAGGGRPCFWPHIIKTGGYQLCGFSTKSSLLCVQYLKSSSSYHLLSVFSSLVSHTRSFVFFSCFRSFFPWHLPTCHDPRPPMTDYSGNQQQLYNNHRQHSLRLVLLI